MAFKTRSRCVMPWRAAADLGRESGDRGRRGGSPCRGCFKRMKQRQEVTVRRFCFALRTAPSEPENESQLYSLVVPGKLLRSVRLFLTILRLLYCSYHPPEAVTQIVPSATIGERSLH